MKQDFNFETTQGNAVQIDSETLYYQALFLAFKRFIEGEKQRHFGTQDRLIKSIEAAKTLYKD